MFILIPHPLMCGVIMAGAHQNPTPLMSPMDTAKQEKGTGKGDRFIF